VFLCDRVPGHLQILRSPKAKMVISSFDEIFLD
jgi:hypothetical protein